MDNNEAPMQINSKMNHTPTPELNNTTNANLLAAATELLDAAICARDFIASLKSCIPDWAERMKITGEGYTAKLDAAIAKAGGAS